MLKLIVKEPDIFRISKLLGKNKLKSSITNSSIIIENDNIPAEVIDILVESADIISVQNFCSGNSEICCEENLVKSDVDSENQNLTGKNLEPEIHTESSDFTDFREVIISTKSDTENDLVKIFDESVDSEYHEKEDDDEFVRSEVEEKQYTSKHAISRNQILSRGEVYQLGELKVREIGFGAIQECVLIIQNDYISSASDETIGIFCTSDFKKQSPVQFSFRLSPETMIDHNMYRIQTFDMCSLYVGYIKGFKRNELGRYLGTMNSSFMNSLQPAIDYCLGLKRSRTVNWAQIQMLSTVSISDLMKISESKLSDSEKVTEFLKLFNFDISQNGVNYIKEAILEANQRGDYRLEDLAIAIAERDNIEATEVLRIIVTRVKNQFGFKKSPAISFIRLIDKFIKKG